MVAAIAAGQVQKLIRAKRSEDKLPVGGMWLLLITAGICKVTYQGDGKYLTFNFRAVR